MNSTVLANNSVIAQLNKDVENINKPELSDEKRALLLSELLTDQYLQAETIKMIEEIDPKSQNPALLVNLGKLYQSVGSKEQAEKTYAKAIKLADSSQESVELTLAMDGLAEVLTSQGRKKEAEQLLIDINEKINVLESKNPQLQSSSSTCHEIGGCGACFINGLTGKCVLTSRGYKCRPDLC